MNSAILFERPNWKTPHVRLDGGAAAFEMPRRELVKRGIVKCLMMLVLSMAFALTCLGNESSSSATNRIEIGAGKYLGMDDRHWKYENSTVSWWSWVWNSWWLPDDGGEWRNSITVPARSMKLVFDFHSYVWRRQYATAKAALLQFTISVPSVKLSFNGHPIEYVIGENTIEIPFEWLQLDHNVLEWEDPLPPGMVWWPYETNYHIANAYMGDCLCRLSQLQQSFHNGSKDGVKLILLIANAIPSNVRARQRQESNLVDIYYDLEVPSGEAANISLSFIGDQGNPPATSVTGDVGDGVYTGKNRHIVWDAGTDWPDKTNDVVAVVTGSEEARSDKFKIMTEKFAVSDVRCDYFHGEYGRSGRHQTFLSRTTLNLHLEFSGGTENHPVDHYLVNGKRVDGREYDLDVARLYPGEHLEVIAVDRNGEKSDPFIANFDMADTPLNCSYHARRLPLEHRVEYWSFEMDTMTLWDGIDTCFTMFDAELGLDFIPSIRFSRHFDSSTGEFREGTDLSGNFDIFGEEIKVLRKAQSFGKFAGADIAATLSGGKVSRWDVSQQRWVESFNLKRAVKAARRIRVG